MLLSANAPAVPPVLRKQNTGSRPITTGRSFIFVGLGGPDLAKTSRKNWFRQARGAPVMGGAAPHENQIPAKSQSGLWVIEDIPPHPMNL